MKISRRDKIEVLLALFFIGILACCLFQQSNLRKQNLLLEENFNGMDQRVSDLESSLEELRK